MFGHTRAAEFGPLKLEAVRDAFASGSWQTPAEKADPRRAGKPAGWARTLVSRQLGRVELVFEWAVAEELVPAAVLHGFQAVRDVAAMFRLQFLAGCRSGEVQTMKAGEVDPSAGPDCWVYPPSRHKGNWRGQDRRIALGPKAVDVLRPWLAGLAADDYIFNPERQRRADHERPAAARKSKPTPNTELLLTSVTRAATRTCEPSGLAEGWTPDSLSTSFRKTVASFAAACSR